MPNSSWKEMGYREKLFAKLVLVRHLGRPPTKEELEGMKTHTVYDPSRDEIRVVFFPIFQVAEIVMEGSATLAALEALGSDGKLGHEAT